jgi:hypothetical protein
MTIHKTRLLQWIHCVTQSSIERWYILMFTNTWWWSCMTETCSVEKLRLLRSTVGFIQLHINTRNRMPDMRVELNVNVAKCILKVANKSFENVTKSKYLWFKIAFTTKWKTVWIRRMLPDMFRIVYLPILMSENIKIKIIIIIVPTFAGLKLGLLY